MRLLHQTLYGRGGAIAQGAEDEPQPLVGSVDNERREHDGASGGGRCIGYDEVQAAVEVEPDAGLDKDPVATQVAGDPVTVEIPRDMQQDGKLYGKTLGLPVVDTGGCARTTFNHNRRPGCRTRQRRTWYWVDCRDRARVGAQKIVWGEYQRVLLVCVFVPFIFQYNNS